MAKQSPVDKLIQALEAPDLKGLSRLDVLRRRWDQTGQGLKLTKDPLGSKGKTFLVYAEGAPREQGTSIVVKFNPVGEKDPYLDDVYKEYRILTKLKPQHIAPTPLFCSSNAEEKVVGTAFIAMTWVEGPIFRTVGEIPQDRVFEVYQVILRKLAEVHRIVLGDRELRAMHHNTQSYWQEVVDDAKADYMRTVGWWRWWFWPFPESYIFSNISRGEKPKSRQRIGVVHGNLDIGNFVLNPELTEVRAILNWKYEQNGDRLIDVASLLLGFLDKGRYSVSVPQQFTYAATDKQVSDLVNAYMHHERNGFEHEDLQFAKAVCCLKLICVVKRGVHDSFEGHELSHFPEITENPDMVLNLLYRHAEKLYATFSQ